MTAAAATHSGTPSAAQPATGAPAIAATGPVVLGAPAAGARISIPVGPGQPVALPDQVFDPASSRYVIDGSDLVVIPSDRGVIVFAGFFLHPDNPPTLSVLGGPPVTANELLARADLVAGEQGSIAVAAIPVPGESATGAGPSGDQRSVGGGADFAPYDPGDIGPGLDPTGPLGPTALAYRADFPPLDDGFGDHGDDERAATPPPGPGVPPEPIPPPGSGEPPDPGVRPEPPSSGPVVTIAGATVGVIAEGSRGFPYAATLSEPVFAEGSGLRAERINGIDPANLALDAEREVNVSFVGEVARQHGSLGVFQIRPDGSFADVALVFPDVNTTDATLPSRLGGQGPLDPGATFSLGSLPEGTQLGFFLVADGANLNPGWLGLPNGASFPEGAFEIRRDGDRLTLLQNGAPVDGALFVTVDPDPRDPQVNRLNPDGATHVASWFDAATGDLLFSFEDRLTGGPDGEGDFNDATFRLHFGAAGDRQLFFGGGTDDGAFRIVIADDGGVLTGAELQLTGAAAGDRIQPRTALDTNGDGLVDGTGIRVEANTGSRFVLTGQGTIDQYDAVLNGLRLVQDGELAAGVRTLVLIVTDADGNRSQPAPITVTILDPPDDGGPGNDVLTAGPGLAAIAGRAGDDILRGGDGPDFLSGGDGADQLFGDAGDDLLIGGPDQDRLVGGPGSDRFVIAALGDGHDTILDFDLAQGDQLDLERLFAGSGFDLLAAQAGSFLRFIAIDADGDAAADIGVVADLDGAGAGHVPVQVATLLDPLGFTAAAAITEVTTFAASDGATN